MLLIVLTTLLIAIGLSSTSPVSFDYRVIKKSEDLNQTNTLHSSTITPTLLIRITSITLLFSAVLSFNGLYTKAIGSGLGLYSGLFNVTSVTQSIEIFLYLMGAFILLGYANESPKKNKNASNPENGGCIQYPEREWKINVPNRFTVGTTSFTGLNTSTPENGGNLHLPNGFTVSVPEYSLIILFTTIGASFLISSADLVSMYLSIELQSFAVYILAAIYRNSESATSAGLKYFLLGALSSALILLGSSLIYSYSGLTNLDSIYMVNNVGANGIYNVITLGLLIITVGFLFKVAAAPFHNWAPDVYDGVPTIVTTWLTVMPKISIFVFLLELVALSSGNGVFQNYSELGLSTAPSSLGLPDLKIEDISIYQTVLPCGSETGYLLSMDSINTASVKTLLLSTSLLSLVIGTVVGLAQYRLKRLLAYSTISHVGFLLLALSVNTQDSISGFLFYLIQYSITNLNLFFIILALGYIMFSSTEMKSSNDLSSPEAGHTENGGNLKSEGVFSSHSNGNEKSIYSNFLSGSSSLIRNSNGLTVEMNTGDQQRVFQVVPDNPTSSTVVRSTLEQTPVYSAPWNKDITLIAELKGQFKNNPVLSLSFALCLFSMAGIPPLIGFFAKYLVLYSAIENGYYFLALVGILASVVSASYYLRVIKVLFMDLPENWGRFNSELKIHLMSSGVKKHYGLNTDNFSVLSSTHCYIVAVLTLLIVLFILSPSLFLNSSNLLALFLFTA